MEAYGGQHTAAVVEDPRLKKTDPAPKLLVTICACDQPDGHCAGLSAKSLH
jgi:hypothetical protein